MEHLQGLAARLDGICDLSTEIVGTFTMCAFARLEGTGCPEVVWARDLPGADVVACVHVLPGAYAEAFGQFNRHRAFGPYSDFADRSD